VVEKHELPRRLPVSAVVDQDTAHYAAAAVVEEKLVVVAVVVAAAAGQELDMELEVVVDEVELELLVR
jgi:hypothetical protein